MASKQKASRSASGLHSVGGMMVRIVGIVAVVLLAGCGVGADESYEALTATSSGQALQQSQASDTPAETPAAGPQSPENTTPVPGKDPGTVALPQDPIPVFVGKPAPQPLPGLTVDPGVAGLLPPPLPAPLP